MSEDTTQPTRMSRLPKKVFFEHCASELYLNTGDELKFCFRAKEVERCEYIHRPMSTWKVKGSDIISLIKTGDNRTLLFSRNYNAIYCVQADYVLPRAIPPVTVVVGQFVIDHEGSQVETGRIILFDIMYDGGEFLGDRLSIDRYTRLRNLERLFVDTRIGVQWVGYEMDDEQLGRLKPTLPHQIEGTFKLPEVVNKTFATDMPFPDYNLDSRVCM
jgi:hypothetical protein